MRPSADDVSSTVDYSIDRWQMDRVPWAMWFCVGGLAISLHTESRGMPGAALAFVYLALLALAFAGWAGTTLIERSDYPWYVVVPVVIVIVVVIAGFISLFGSSRGYPAYGRQWWSQLVHPPPNVFGWMLLYLGGGWIAFALLRHIHPARPIISLSPAGLTFNRAWLPDVFIPWQEVHAVGPLEAENTGLAPTIYPHALAVTVSKEFYERVIAPKRSILSPPGAEAMFRPKGTMMQMVLTTPEIVVEFEDYRAPIDARWKAFREKPRADAPARPTSARHVYGRWSYEGSWGQMLMFGLPILGAAAVVLHASGIWPG